MVSLRLPPVPWMVTCGLLLGTFTSSRYVPGLTAITTREGLLAGTAFTAACTVVYCPLPSLATVSVVAAAAAFVVEPVEPFEPFAEAVDATVPMEPRGPVPDLRSAGTSAVLSSVYG
ncbi:hypothetical protein QF032_003707 [Streptomyces achromogenes]|nr:hypothetical protein [Streptomyces achromogenes]